MPQVSRLCLDLWGRRGYNFPLPLWEMALRASGEMADALASEASARKGVEVRVFSRASKNRSLSNPWAAVFCRLSIATEDTERFTEGHRKNLIQF